MLAQFMERPPLKVRLNFKLVIKQNKADLHGQGMGRHSPAEVAQLAEADLRALSTQLGGKPFFLGDQPTSTDAAIFGILAQALWVLPGSVQEKLVKEELKNLEEFCQRMRKEYWPDWETLYVPPKPKGKDKAAEKKKDEPKAAAKTDDKQPDEKEAEEKKEEAAEGDGKVDEKEAEAKPAEGGEGAGEEAEKKE